nr:MAG TPA: hypothetical protein [Caudoviricetes sp.]
MAALRGGFLRSWGRLRRFFGRLRDTATFATWQNRRLLAQEEFWMLQLHGGGDSTRRPVVDALVAGTQRNRYSRRPS